MYYLRFAIHKEISYEQFTKLDDSMGFFGTIRICIKSSILA